MGFLSSLFGGGGKATRRAAEQNKEIIGDYNRKATGHLDKGMEKSTGYLTEARDLYRPITKMGERGAGLYADAMGLNGAEGAQRASEAFTTGPSYQFNLNQGLEALERRAASQGRLGSGQTGIDTMTYAQGLAGNEHRGWLDRLGGYNSMWAGGLDGQAGQLGQLSDLFQRDAGNRVGLAGSVASGLMGANNQYAAGKEAGSTGLGSLLGIVGKGVGALVGGPAGAAIGGAFGYGAK